MALWRPFLTTEPMGPKGLILAAPASGSGKTVVTLALLRALAGSGIKVAGAKIGPDYIDPSFHAAAARRPSVNLDLWAMRPDTLDAVASTIDADLVICEGVMGLFDGAGRKGNFGSTADLAVHSDWPVVLIVDAAKQSASIAALVSGFANHRADVPLAGVILNRVASARHGVMLNAALQEFLPDLPVFGLIPRDPALVLPERHLGLVLAGEHDALESFLDQAAAIVAASVDLAAIEALARRFRVGSEGIPPGPPPGKRFAVARDAAFAFLYPHLLELWRRQGSVVVPFSPLADEAPDESTDFIFLPGGYPELHGRTLAGAGNFHSGLKAAAARGVQIYGECGGYMVLGRSLVDAQGVHFPMAGLLPVTTSIAQPRRQLGYRQARALAGPWAGASWRGHEFHYASVVEAEEGPSLWSLADADGASLGEAGHVSGSVSGSFFHVIDRAE